mmetsp:Transcript_6000/g.6554  ORF Transcript_6000/g.6554 Transcript_6000/m.6554 type:complete len:209 (+) Transcript_6000:1844-2470(+)
MSLDDRKSDIHFLFEYQILNKIAQNMLMQPEFLLDLCPVFLIGPISQTFLLQSLAELSEVLEVMIVLDDEFSCFAGVFVRGHLSYQRLLELWNISNKHLSINDPVLVNQLLDTIFHVREKLLNTQIADHFAELVIFLTDVQISQQRYDVVFIDFVSNSKGFQKNVNAIRIDFQPILRSNNQSIFWDSSTIEERVKSCEESLCTESVGI